MRVVGIEFLFPKSPSLLQYNDYSFLSHRFILAPFAFLGHFQSDSNYLGLKHLNKHIKVIYFSKRGITHFWGYYWVIERGIGAVIDYGLESSFRFWGWGGVAMEGVRGKYYAVRKCRVPGIYRSWEEAERKVLGHKCAQQRHTCPMSLGRASINATPILP
ncbi:hypothetical protein PIB30_023707 [Stylosanthes scabra]|uniref:Ribonuclease H1 N-terminal domain-containing protein n=1 Tax=Stylosanthes scabra TaxID=79078 RepID=A0ABU6UA18_9FABA|nr:hypothetical protein [Stylosanthes scabra]